MIPYDPMHLYRLHEAQLALEVEERRRVREFLARRAEERRIAREALRAERRTARAEAGAGRFLIALLLPARRS